MKTYTIPVSNQHKLERVEEVRTKAQRETVLAIVKSEDFDFACHNPFTVDVGKYVGPFLFSYYLKQGTLVAVRINGKGEIDKKYEIKKETTKVKNKTSDLSSSRC